MFTLENINSVFLVKLLTMCHLLIMDIQLLQKLFFSKKTTKNKQTTHTWQTLTCGLQKTLLKIKIMQYGIASEILLLLLLLIIIITIVINF